MSDHCNGDCDAKASAKKLQSWLRTRGRDQTTYGAVVWHKGEHHITIDPAIEILGAFAAAEGMTADEIKAEVGAVK